MSKLQTIWNKFKQFDLDRLIMILSVFILMVALWGNYEKSLRISDAETLNTNLKDTVVFWKTKEGFHKARITVLEANTVRDFVNLTSRDTVINKLQKLVDKNKEFIKKQGNVIILETETRIKTSTETKVDNNTKVQSDGKSPVYTSKINLGKWVTGSTIATRDSTVVDFSFREEMDFVIGRQKTGFLGLGKGKSFVEATLHNPYSEIKTIRSYQPKAPKDKKVHIGPTLIYGIGQNFAPGVYIGVGVTWGVINF